MKPTFFKSQSELHDWFTENHARTGELVAGFYKGQSRKLGITYREALDEALCFGWIDGIRRSLDEVSYTIRFTPRKAKSIWSAINVKRAERLTKLKLMQPSGLRQMEMAKQDGRWKSAYQSQSKMAVPEDLQASLDRNPRAKAFFATLDSRNRYAVLFRIHTAQKMETRARRVQQFVAMLGRGEKLYP